MQNKPYATRRIDSLRIARNYFLKMLNTVMVAVTPATKPETMAVSCELSFYFWGGIQLLIYFPWFAAGEPAGFINHNQRIRNHETRERRKLLLTPPFKKKHLAETQTIGFLTGVPPLSGGFGTFTR